MSYKRRHKTAILVLILLLVCFFLSESYMVQHAGHICGEDVCTICIHLKESAQTIRELGNLLAYTLCGIILVYILILCGDIAADISSWGKPTPVRLKVRMNN